MWVSNQSIIDLLSVADQSVIDLLSLLILPLKFVKWVLAYFHLSAFYTLSIFFFNHILPFYAKITMNVMYFCKNILKHNVTLDYIIIYCVYNKGI